MIAAAPKLNQGKHSSANLYLLSGMGGQVSSQVSNLTQSTVQEIARPKDKYRIKDYKDLLETEPLSKACCELKSLRATTTFGDYEHEDKETQDWIRNNFEVMRGSITTTIRELASALPMGFAVAEVIYNNRMAGFFGEWRLEAINPLDPEKVTFAGAKGRITHVVYNDGGNKKYIPYNKCLHVVNGLCFNSPYGSPEARRAMPYFRAKNLIFAEMMVAGKNNATGILFGQADSNDTVQLRDSRGNPITNNDGTPRTMTAVEALNFQLQNLESSGFITSDLKTRLQAIMIPSGDAFWSNAIMMLKKELLLSFLTPSLIWDEGSFGGLGNTGMSGNHKNTLDANIAAIVTQMQEEMLEKVVRRLLMLNKHPKVWRRNFGAFKAQAYSDPNFLMTQASNLIAAISSQILPSSDMDVMNALREALGVPPVSDRKNNELLMKQIQMQLMQQQASQGQDPTQAAGQTQGQDPTQAGFSSYWL